jgi:DNA/RNA endonuclease YhcR with UshA esterase domain
MMKYTFLLIAGLMAAGLSGSCLKKRQVEPPDNRGYDPRLPVTHTLARLLELQPDSVIEEDIVVSGIVVMDDRSGNYYKKIVIQDSSGGIEVLMDQSNLYNDYPVGRKVYIRCKGLYLGDYALNPQLGYTPAADGSLSGIPAVLLDQFVVKADYPNMVIPDTVTFAMLAAPSMAKRYLNTLVAVKDAEFAAEHTGVSYAQIASIASATSLTLRDCMGGTISMRNSGYARFQPFPTPAGNGILTGIYTRFNAMPQLCIRDTTDVRFYGERCPLLPDAAGNIRTIDSIRKLFNGMEVVLPPCKIRGIVISDKNNSNVSPGNIIFQGGNDDKGIILYYGGSPVYTLWDSLEIELTGCRLKQYNGKLEIEGVKAAKTKKLGSGKRIAPRVLTIAQLLAAPGVYESTLVKIMNCAFEAGATTYSGSSGNLNILDATGTIRHYTASQASFKDLPLPSGTLSSVCGYIDLYNGVPQIRIRKPGTPVNDVVP